MRNLSSLFQTKKLPYKFGLALSGGGSKGFAHLGVLKALDEKNIHPEIIAGTSAGSFAGALYADGYHPEEILSLFEKKAFKQFAEFTIPQAGIFKANRLHEFLKKHLRAKNFEDLKIQLKVTATNIENGTSVVFDKGPIIPTILASCAFPIIFTPIEIDGIHYVDGGLFKNLPSSLIRKDCQTVVGVNVNPITKQDYKNSLLFIAERSFHYVSMANAIPDRKICDILIEPKKVSNFSMFTLEHTKEIYDIGYHAAIASFKKEKNIPIWGKILETKK